MPLLMPIMPALKPLLMPPIMPALKPLLMPPIMPALMPAPMLLLEKAPPLNWPHVSLLLLPGLTHFDPRLGVGGEGGVLRM